MILSTLCYIESDGKYLMLNRNKKKNDVNGGKWIGVGGKFEKDESPVNCLLREVKEETGLTLKNHFFRGVITFVCEGAESEQMFLFTSTAFDGKLKTCDEGDLAWVEKSEVFDLNLWEGDRIFLRYLDENRPPFLLKLVYDKDGELISVEG